MDRLFLLFLITLYKTNTKMEMKKFSKGYTLN